jgi:hypothetical protein
MLKWMRWILILFAMAASAWAGPLESKEKVVALVFVSSECPISNKLVPELERIHKRFSKKDAQLWIVYPNASDGEPEIAKHRKEFRITAPFARDEKHELVKKSGVTITPEAVVFNEKREIVYRGRITDQFLALGKGRPQPTQHDLRDAIEATLAGEKPKLARTEAVGCFIQDQK